MKLMEGETHVKIVLTGGGTSAGHITPSLAVAHELKQLNPTVETIYIAQTGDSLADIPKEHAAIDKVFSVRAGKFRRYHGAGISQVFDIPTVVKNIRDIWWFGIGILQSYFLLRKLNPDCIFMKGGYVGAPVGLAAAWLHIPYITHDSDALPGLANRIVARWAVLHAVALPKETYPYPQSKTVTVGVPVQADFKPVTEALQKQYLQEIGLEKYGKLLFVTGGGQGSKRLNDAVVSVIPGLLHQFNDLVVVHVAGQTQEQLVRDMYEKLIDEVDRDRVVIKGFLSGLYRYSGAANVVVTRAGATTLAEFAVQHKACVIVPNPFLTGGHQLLNAQVLADRHAAVCISEQELNNNSKSLEVAISNILGDDKEQRELGEQLAKLAHPGAAKELAMVLLKEAQSHTNSK
jgi:UDP-N-acetylglucosamine--N-acetylmuramyl-(pentapeptide) pyrophosphoryl-undecaprenol N-acetylglucosamine transferase